jgi:subtilisin-like proprotein convertase family protein
VPFAQQGDSSSDRIVSDVNVRIKLDYPNLANLKIALRGPGMANPVTLVEADTLTGSQLDAMFDQAGGGLSGRLLPKDSLDAFKGQSGNGDWQLLIWDTKATSLVGALVDWSLEISYAPVKVEAAAVGDVNGDGLDDLALPRPTRRWPGHLPQAVSIWCQAAR